MLARLLFWGAALAVTVAGPPLVLLALVGSPLAIPGALRSSHVLTQPIDDQAVLWLLSCLIWLLWLHLLGSLLVEALRQTRGSTLHMPVPGLLFGANNLLASHLIASLLLTLHPSLSLGSDLAGLSGPAPTTLSGVGVARTFPHQDPRRHGLTRPSVNQAAWSRHVDEGGVSALDPTLQLTAWQEPPAPAATTSSASTTPLTALKSSGQKSPTLPLLECRVLPPQGRHHDTLWDIAQRHLGDGTRWHEIFALNEGRLMPDGHRLTKASLIYPGWTLRLPADARNLPIDHVTPIDTTEPNEPTGPTAAPAPARPRPAGSHAESPRVDPTLATPTAASAAAHAAPADTPSQHGKAAGGATVLTPAATTQPNAAAAKQQAAAASAEPPASAVRARAHASAPGSSEIEDGVGAGLGLAALALLAALTRRRKIAARRRPVGTRPATPAPAVIAAEAQLRREARATVDVAATVRLALLFAAQHCLSIAVKAVWHHPDGRIEVVLAEPPGSADTATRAATGVATMSEGAERRDPDVGSGAGAFGAFGDQQVPYPFEGSDRGWVLPNGARRYLFAAGGSRPPHERIEDALEHAVDPFPLLVPIGNRDGSCCYVNLEPLGLISLTTTDSASCDIENMEHQGGMAHEVEEVDEVDRAAGVREIVAALVLDLAGAPWAELLDIAVPPVMGELATGLEKLTVLDRALIDRLTLSTGQATVDAVSTVGSLEAARRQDPNGAGIIRCAFVAGVSRDEIPPLLLQAATRPSEPLVVLMLDSHPDAHPWTLHEGRLSIPGVADGLEPIRLQAGQHQLLLRLLEYAQDPPTARDDDAGALARDADNPPDTTPAITHSATHGERELTGPSDEVPPEAAAETETETETHVDEGPDDQSNVGEPGEIRIQAPTAHLVRLDHRALTNEDQDQGDAEAGQNGRRDSAAASTSVGEVQVGDKNRDEDPGRPQPASPSGTEPVISADVDGRVQISILGPITVTGTDGSRPRGHVREILVFLALHRRPVTGERLWEAVFPDRPYNGHVLRSRMSDLRRHIRGQLVNDGGSWTLAPDVACDWQTFRALSQGDRRDQLAALDLVRGVPFEGVDGDWLHLEGHHADVEAAIVDLALQLGDELLAEDEPATAGTVAADGLRASPYDERLYQLAMKAAASRGATGQIRALRRQLERVLEDELEPDDTMQPVTQKLIVDLLETHRSQRS